MWLEPLPAVEVVARLREISIFKAVTIDELFRIVRAGRQVRHEAGRVLYHQGQPPTELQLLLDGRVELTTGSGATENAGIVEAPAPLGIEEVLEGAPVRMHTVPGFETAAFPYMTDIGMLTAWGKPLLYGPGSILVAHTDEEYIEIADLERATRDYVTLARELRVS